MSELKLWKNPFFDLKERLQYAELEIAKSIDEQLTDLVGHKVAFSLFVWTDGRSCMLSIMNGLTK